VSDLRLAAIPDVHGHAKGEHKPFSDERPIAYSPRMLFLWFYHACSRGAPRFLMVSDHINYLTFEDPGAVHTVRRALKLAEAGDLYGAAEAAGVDVAHAAVVSQGLRRGMRFSIGAELDNDPRARPDAQNIVDAMRPDGMIRSVHFLSIEHPEKGADWQWPFDNPEYRDLFEVVGVERVWEMYAAKLVDDISKLPGQIVGHFYVPAIFGHWPEQSKLEEYEDRILDACAARGMAVEINTRALYRDHPEEQKQKYRAALLRLIKKAKSKSVGIAVASDAHSPKDQGGGFAEVLKLLDECKINELVFPVAGRLARVALRATKEHLEKVKSQEPAVPPGSSITGFSRAELGLPERDEAAERGLSKSGRDAGPRRRASSPARTSKKPARAAAEREEKPKPPKPAKKPPEPRQAKAAATKPAAAKPPAAKAPAVKAVSKKSPVKPATPKRSAPAKKASAKKTPVKKLPPLRKGSQKKTAVKKTAAKKAPIKKVPVKKAAVRKSAPARTKKAAVKKSSPPAKRKPPAPKKATVKKTAKRR
jgi:HisJ family histidinol phosphate phosphatase